jgi:hypothetical protein
MVMGSTGITTLTAIRLTVSIQVGEVVMMEIRGRILFSNALKGGVLVGTMEYW